MRARKWAKALGVLAVAGALVFAGEPAFATSGHGSYTCTGGEIPSGTYRNVTVAGPCAVGVGAVIDVTGSVTVLSGAMLDAQSASSKITVRHNVTALKGSMLGLGCQPAAAVGNSAHPCTVDPTGQSEITVRGSITAIGAMAVLINGVTVKGSVTMLGGGAIPWSIKNNTIGRSITSIGQTTEWIGVMFNKVGGSVTLLKISVTDTHPGAPGMYIVQNKVHRNLVCYGITPGVSGGFVPGAVNTVGGHTFGQCTALV